MGWTQVKDVCLKLEALEHELVKFRDKLQRRLELTTVASLNSNSLSKETYNVEVLAISNLINEVSYVATSVNNVHAELCSEGEISYSKAYKAFNQLSELVSRVLYSKFRIPSTIRILLYESWRGLRRFLEGGD